MLSSSHPASTRQHSEMTQICVDKYDVQLSAHSQNNVHTEKNIYLRHTFYPNGAYDEDQYIHTEHMQDKRENDI